MFNRSGLIALGIAVAIIAWGAFHADEPDPRAAAHGSRRHERSSADAAAVTSSAPAGTAAFATAGVAVKTAASSPGMTPGTTSRSTTER